MKVYVLIQILILLLYSTASAAIMSDENCGLHCSWVETSTRTWVETSTIETEVSETTEQFTYKPTAVTSKSSKRQGPNDSYLCYVLLNGGSYGEYSVEPTMGSENQTLYNNGIAVRECNFQYPSAGNSGNRFSKRNTEWASVATPWVRVVEGGYWLETKTGYWDCIPAPVPEPATMLLFGVGVAGLAGFGRRRK